MTKIKEVLISDESQNTYGFVVKTSGIMLEKFMRNPVMFYNHDREAGVIGRWEDIRTDQDKLFAVPVFDEEDETGLKISKKVKNGFVRGASIGIEILDLDDTGKIVLSSELTECSICDIPSNKNAIMLYQNGKPLKNKEMYLNLSSIKNQQTMKDEDVKKIIEALGLGPDATIDEILTAIKSILSGDSPKVIIENAIKQSFVKEYEKPGLLKLAASDFVSFSKYMEDRQNEAQKERKPLCIELINAAIRDGRLQFPLNSQRSREFLLKVLLTNYEEGKFLLENLNKRLFVSEFLKRPSINPKEDRGTWTLKDYRKNAPHELSANPELYERLLEEEKISKKRK